MKMLCNISWVLTLIPQMKRLVASLLFMMWCAHAPACAQGTLCVSELLFQPRSGEAEYVELYNNTAAVIDLSDYHIVRWIGDSLGKHYPLPSHSVAPNDYVVLTKDAASVTANHTVKYLSKLLECDLPTYPNDGGAVVLARKDSTVVEHFHYLPEMHSRLLRNKAGVALERKSFDTDCNAAGNWFSASSTAGYGTPTSENSQSTEYLSEETGFNFSSTMLSPDGDGYQDELSISYQLEGNEIYVNIMLFDARGNLLRRLLNDALLGTHGEIVWDGRDDNGTLLPQGRYVMYINLYDLHGTRQTIKRSVSIIF